MTLNSVVIEETSAIAELISEVAEAMVGLVTEVTDSKSVTTVERVSAAVII